MRVAITGANGSLGQNLLNHSIQAGDLELVACVRSQAARETLCTADCVTPAVVNYRDEAALAKWLIGANCLVHLAGILIEPTGNDYQTANVETTRAVVNAAVGAGVGHLILVSVLGADSASPNRYFRSKGEAERLVAAAGVSASIIRAPMLLGPDTAGAGALRASAKRGKALLLGGGDYILQPLDIDDLSQALGHCIRNPRSGVFTYELAGPEAISYRELVARFGEVTGRTIALRTVPISLARLGAAIRKGITGGGISAAVIDVISTDEVPDENAARALGVTLTPLDETLRKIASQDSSR